MRDHHDLPKIIPVKIQQIRIGIPKGSLQESTLALFKSAGMSFFGSDRTLWLSSSDSEIQPVLLRPQEIPNFVASGELDCGLAGWDWIVESNTGERLSLLADLCYSKRSFRPVKWVLAVSEDSPWKTLEDLRTINPPIRVSTELVRITDEWLAEKGIRAKVDFSWGATEAKPPVFADAIVDCTETGSSLRANRLVVIDTLLESTTRFFTSRKIMHDRTEVWKRTKVQSIAMLLQSCLAAEQQVSISVICNDTKTSKIIEALIPCQISFFRHDAGEKTLFEIASNQENCRRLLPLFARNGAAEIKTKRLDMWHVAA